MKCMVLAVAAFVGAPWSEPDCYFTVQPTKVVTFAQCEPVRVAIEPPMPPPPAPLAPAPVAAAPAIASESVLLEAGVTEDLDDTADQIVTESISADSYEDDLVTENAGYFMNGLGAPSMFDMALDWGVATIGPGTLMPVPGIFPNRFPGWWGNNGNSSANGSYPYVPLMPYGNNQVTYVNVDGDTVIVNCGCCKPSDLPPPIPEPGAVWVWLVGLVAIALVRREVIRRNFQSRPRSAPVTVSSAGKSFDSVDTIGDNAA